MQLLLSNQGEKKTRKFLNFNLEVGQTQVQKTKTIVVFSICP